jgi:hypothetical protein
MLKLQTNGLIVPLGSFILDTYASNVGMGSVLSQVQDGQEKVISYYSKSFNKAERKYCVTRREIAQPYVLS